VKAVVKDHLRRDPPVLVIPIRHHRARRSCAGEIRSPRSFPSPDFFYTMNPRAYSVTKPRPLPPIDDLRRLLEYNPDTGVFTWLVSRVCVRAGSEAGYTDKRGYKRVKINGRRHLAHRLAWLIHTGEVPSAHIDHIDGNKSNNRIANLREATSGENSHNVSTPKHNTSGIKGVSWDRNSGKWKAQIAVEGVHLHLGLFRSIECAADAVREARCRLHGDFANHGQ
jgi:hypothetical protein